MDNIFNVGDLVFISYAYTRQMETYNNVSLPGDRIGKVVRLSNNNISLGIEFPCSISNLSNNLTTCHGEGRAKHCFYFNSKYCTVVEKKYMLLEETVTLNKLLLL